MSAVVCRKKKKLIKVLIDKKIIIIKIKKEL